MALGFVCVTAFAQGPVSAEEAQERESVTEQVQERAQTRWEEQADKELGLEKGLARKLMTQEEWRTHQGKMQTMTAQEKERYRKEIHERMEERAKEKGISAPETPRARGTMDGTGALGTGKGGMGKGGGRGR